MILFCLPYAGGSKVIYYKWKRYLNSSIQLEPIELKGRGKRFNEDFYENLEEAIEDVFENIKDKILDEEFIKEVIELGGTPQEVADNKELLHLFTPILRSDFKMIEKYLYKEKKEIQCDISILNGKEDDITLKELLEWENHGDKGFKVYNFEGNHFFINTNVENITKIINTTLFK